MAGEEVPAASKRDPARFAVTVPTYFHVIRAGLTPEEGNLTDAQIGLRDRYLAAFGAWSAHCDHLLRHDPGYFEVLLDILLTSDDGVGLSAQEAALIRIALDACFTGLDRDALRQNIRHALRLGIAVEEIEQVLKMTAHLGVHSCAIGFPALREAKSSLQSAGKGR